MRLTRLEVTNLRIIEAATLLPEGGVNLIAGANGSGKSSLLEGIHLIGTGRSFRSRRAEEFIRHGQSALTVHARVRETGGDELPVGVEKRGQTTRIRLSEEAIRSAAVLARRIPVIVILPESQRLISDGAELRRQFLDWGLFHVEPGYVTASQNYRRVLKQRNAQLRAQASPRVLAPWDAELGDTGELLHGLRVAHLDSMLKRVGSLVAELTGLEVSIHYVPGWDTKGSLAEAAAKALGRDAARGYTGVGPHRADLELLVGGVPAQRVLSRGEAKLFCLALWLAQAREHHQQAARTPLILIDDLASELDAANQARVFQSLSSLGAQTFVTTVSNELLRDLPGPLKTFHVERGKVSEMV
jgi:DNA replication and repair protein RecF